MTPDSMLSDVYESDFKLLKTIHICEHFSSGFSTVVCIISFQINIVCIIIFFFGFSKEHGEPLKG